MLAIVAMQGGPLDAGPQEVRFVGCYVRMRRREFMASLAGTAASVSCGSEPGPVEEVGQGLGLTVDFHQHTNYKGRK